MVGDFRVAARIIENPDFGDLAFENLAGVEAAAFGILFLSERQRASGLQVADVDGRREGALAVYINFKRVAGLIPGDGRLMRFAVEQRGVGHAGIDLLPGQKHLELSA